MRNIIKTLFIALVITSCAMSQTIIVRGQDNGNLPEDFLSSGNYYYKDVNNYLDNFTGTWEYINGNEKFEIILTKVVQYHVVNTNLNLDYYEDGITIQYKKYTNNNLSFESPTYQNPNFISTDGIILKGWIKDYGRISKTLYLPFSTEVYEQGGDPIAPHCRITKQPEQQGEPPKVSFNLDLTGTDNYDKETYEGQPTFSIPNDVILTKVE
jgi:hypothetical protein